jgi:E3 ubiquitin-protein ligase HERC4
MIIENGQLFAFGKNDCGELGLNDEMNRLTPTELLFFQKLKIKSIYCGENHTFVALGKLYIINLDNNKLYCFGNNVYGNLGLSDNNNRLTPTENIFFNNMEIKKIICGENFSIVLLS